ncbi:MAG: hypothetical protein NTX49_01840 [Chlamydiae bacterium]|nr:hypothetical protein [Chlamydiota bacterium]
MTNISLNQNVIYPSSFSFNYHTTQNAGLEAVSAVDQLSVMERSSTLFSRIYGVISGVFLLTSIVGIVSNCKEFIYGPAEMVRRKYQGRFSHVRLGADLGRNLGSAAASMLRVAAVARGFFGFAGRFWTYASLNVVANCFGIIASGCEIVSNVQSIEHINSLLKSKACLIKIEFLLQHRQSSIFSIALAIGNIAMSVLFSLSVMGISGLVFLLVIPILGVAMKQKFQVISTHGTENECCKVFN